MFVIRQAMPDDVPTLLKLARMVHFINLPADKDIITSKVSRSRRSFAGDVSDDRQRQFMFVLEDSETGGVIGTSSLICRIGWEGWPQIFLQVTAEVLTAPHLQKNLRPTFPADSTNQ